MIEEQLGLGVTDNLCPSRASLLSGILKGWVAMFTCASFHGFRGPGSAHTLRRDGWPPRTLVGILPEGRRAPRTVKRRTHLSVALGELEGQLHRPSCLLHERI